MIRSAATLLVLAACGTPDAEGPDAGCDPVAARDIFTGRDGWTLTIVATNPSPPEVGESWWAVRLDDPDGAPMIDPAAVEVSAFMPEHGMSGTTTPTVTAEPDGLVVGPIELRMPGAWEVRFDVEAERIVVPVCVD